MAEGYGQKCVNLDPKEPLHKNDMMDLTISKENTDEAQKLFKSGNFKKAEEIANRVLEKCLEFTDIKILYIECLLENNKPQEVITLIYSKLNDTEKVMEEFDYYLAKAYYFNSD